MRCKLDWSLCFAVAASVSELRGKGCCAVHTPEIWPCHATLSGLQDCSVKFRHTDRGLLCSGSVVVMSLMASPTNAQLGLAFIIGFGTSLCFFVASALPLPTPPSSPAAPRSGSPGRGKPLLPLPPQHAGPDKAIAFVMGAFAALTLVISYHTIF